MSDKCPDIHQAFPPPQLVFLRSCRPYINAVVSNRLNICRDVGGGGGFRQVLGLGDANLRPSELGGQPLDKRPSLSKRGAFREIPRLPKLGSPSPRSR